MKHFINLKDILAKILEKSFLMQKKKKKREKLNTLEVDMSPLKGKMLIQMFENASSRTRISFYLAINSSEVDTYS